MTKFKITISHNNGNTIEVELDDQHTYIPSILDKYLKRGSLVSILITKDGGVKSNGETMYERKL